MNSQIQSSMKYENLSGLTEDEIINKYEQIRDLSYQFGKLNSQLIDNEEKINIINKEMIDLDKNYNKTTKNLSMEVENIQILKNQISQYEKENKELRQKVQMKLSNDSGKKRGNSSEHNNGQKESQKLLSENIDYIPVFNK